MKDYQGIIRSKMVAGQYISFGKLAEKLPKNNGNYWRAWQDMKTNGQLQENNVGQSRINQ